MVITTSQIAYILMVANNNITQRVGIRSSPESSATDRVHSRTTHRGRWIFIFSPKRDWIKSFPYNINA